MKDEKKIILTKYYNNTITEYLLMQLYKKLMVIVSYYSVILRLYKCQLKGYKNGEKLFIFQLYNAILYIYGIAKRKKTDINTIID